jgi:pyruvate/2-oxoglutarate dehydrogenase complex dihydrolipoamide acyltransferase (E2) component
MASEVNGVVKSIGVTAGDTTSADQVLATIEVPDRAYKAEMSVTIEQSKKVTVGDFADVNTGYWGNSGITQDLPISAPTLISPRKTGCLFLIFPARTLKAAPAQSVNRSKEPETSSASCPQRPAFRFQRDFVYITPQRARLSATGTLLLGWMCRCLPRTI